MVYVLVWECVCSREGPNYKISLELYVTFESCELLSNMPISLRGQVGILRIFCYIINYYYIYYLVIYMGLFIGLTMIKEDFRKAIC